MLEVITRKPEVEGKEWRIITHNMNQYLFDNGLWNTQSFFYCEEKCYKLFRSLVRGKDPNAYVNSSTDGAENIQSETPANEVSNGVAKLYGFNSDPILEASLLYQSSRSRERSTT